MVTVIPIHKFEVGRRPVNFTQRQSPRNEVSIFVLSPMKKSRQIFKAFFAVVMIMAIVAVYVKDLSCGIEHIEIQKHLSQQKHHDHATTDDDHQHHDNMASAAHSHVHSEADHHSNDHKHNGKKNDKDCCKEETANFFSSLTTSHKIQLKVLPFVWIAPVVIETQEYILLKPFVANFILGWLDKAHPPRGVNIRILIRSFQI